MVTAKNVDSGLSSSGDKSDEKNLRLLRFGEFQIDLLRRRLTRNGERIDIQSKPFDVLVHLARRPGTVVTRDEMLNAFWRGGVHDEALTRCVGIVRRTLDDTGDPPHFVETVWGQGYRFIAPVSVENESDAQESGVDLKSGFAGTGDFAPGKRTGRSHARLAAALSAIALVFSVLLAWHLVDRPGARPDSRMAVLPMSWEQPDDEWLARALSDQLAETIARIEGLTVISQYTDVGEGDSSNPVAIGRRLDVDLVLTSRLKRSQEGFGLSSRLIAIDSGEVVWSFTLPTSSRQANPEMVEEVVGSVARSLWADLRVSRPMTKVSPEAYREYLLARYYWHQRTDTGLRAAIEAYDAALAIEPEYAEAHAGVAESWLLLPLYGAVAPKEVIPLAREAASRALSVDRRQARALGVLGVIAMQYDWEWSEAESLLRQALTLQPNDATTEQWLGELYCYQRRFEECTQHLRVAQGLEPLSPVLRMLTASVALWSGDFEGAVAAYREALEDAPGFPMALHALGISYTGLGAWKDAAAHYLAAEPGLGFAVIGGPLVYVTARDGSERDATDLFTRLVELSEKRYVPPSKLAIAWLGLGNRERALALLRRAVEERDDRLVYLAVDPHYRELYGHPEFLDILSTVGLNNAMDRQ